MTHTVRLQRDEESAAATKKHAMLGELLKEKANSGVQVLVSSRGDAVVKSSDKYITLATG